MLKDTYLQVKIPKELKQAFFEKAVRQAHIPSALVRKWVEEYLKEDDQ